MVFKIPNKQLDIVRISDVAQYKIWTCTWGYPPQLSRYHALTDVWDSSTISPTILIKVLNLFLKTGIAFFDKSGMVMPCKKNKHSHIYGLAITLLYVRLMCGNLMLNADYSVPNCVYNIFLVKILGNIKRLYFSNV